MQITNINGVSKASIPVDTAQESLVIQQLKSINQQTGAFTYLPNSKDPKSNKKSVIITGKHEQVVQASDLVSHLTKPLPKQSKQQEQQLLQIQQQYQQAQNHLI